MLNIYILIDAQTILTCKGRILQIGCILEEMNPKQTHVQKMPFSLVCLANEESLKKKIEKERSTNFVYLWGRCYAAVCRVKFTFLHKERMNLWDHNTNDFRVQLVMFMRKAGEVLKKNKWTDNKTAPQW